ncbi:hypothetical protein KYN89_05380 [Alteriqipengyuania sp. NZ-12B]|uniref:Barstar (barnase inhibitor) domain-containing protein n=1 Tax=Alteriqipengyuania abyssalis TaxID=2860200 RepID=A0ABS7PBW9_9SPHN|nr:hypothetical protein [Alteriqipengyuania abyssalis]MBY8336471.1 hypothetical protein [Alteriqipengyuania abyssalis]
MAHEFEGEHYRICIDAHVTSKDALFSRVTDTAYLGYSSFTGWDAFMDMFHSRLSNSVIQIEIENRDLCGLPERDRSTWVEVLDELKDEFPDKIRLVQSNG